MSEILNLSGYVFRPMTDLATKRVQLQQICEMSKLKGTIILGNEGVNAFLAGEPKELKAALELIYSVVGKIEFKESFSGDQPFRRMLVKIKKEIVTMGKEFDIQANASQYVKPKEFKQWLDEGRDIIVIDTRNDYELRVGKFKGCVDLNIRTFRAFPQVVEALPEEWKDKTIVTFCTGGIRCEKAAPWMVKEGFKHVYQLEGGILKYFEECGGAHWEGDCFVFDQRVAVDPNLEETPVEQCFNCREPLSVEEQQLPSYIVGESCLRCVDSRV